MSIDDVLSRVATLQQLAGASASPLTQPATAGSTATSTPGPGPSSASGSSFAAALASAEDASLPLSALDSSSGDDSSSDPLSSLGALSSQGSLAGLGSTSNSASALLEQLALAQVNGSQVDGTSLGGALPWSSGYPGAVLPGSAGANVLAAAQTQLGVSEDPPGSNDGPALGQYRAAVAGSQPGQPWCAEFVSWAAARAGEPIGDLGQGLNSVAGITDWASRTGRLLPASATPAAGDLILYGDRHVGIVQSVNPDGSLTTVEGNYGNAVQQVRRSPSEATGYVQM